jgi:c-di-GMP-binding flagellar brake protein YcgR
LSDPLRGTARAQVPAHLVDLSLGGALLRLSSSLEVGAIHDFVLQLDTESVWVQGEVKRCRPRPDGYEVGIEFIGIDPHDQSRLKTYLSRQES